MGSKKSKELYRIKGDERGQLQAFAAMANVAEASGNALLRRIMEREGIPESDNVIFDRKTLAFAQK